MSSYFFLRFMEQKRLNAINKHRVENRISSTPHIIKECEVNHASHESNEEKCKEKEHHQKEFEKSSTLASKKYNKCMIQ